MKLPILASLLLPLTANALLTVTPIPISPSNLYLETWLEFDIPPNASSLTEVCTGFFPSGTFSLSCTLSRSGLFTSSLVTSWPDGSSTTKTFTDNFRWGFIDILGQDNFVLSTSSRDRYSGTLWPYPDFTADAEFVFQTERLPQRVPEPSSSLLLFLLGLCPLFRYAK